MNCSARTLADLPCVGVSVRPRVRVRRFFCDEPSCERRISTERLYGVAKAHARGTDRQREALERIAFALGGEAGARLARELGGEHPDALLEKACVLIDHLVAQQLRKSYPQFIGHRVFSVR